MSSERALANMVFPEPGGPNMSRLWLPAAEITKALLAVSWPFIERSGFSLISSSVSVSKIFVGLFKRG